MTENTTPKKTAYKGFPFRQRLAPVILLALAASLTLFFFGPFDIYSNNTDQFPFELRDFIMWNLLFSLGCAVVLCVILLPLRKRVFDVFYAVFWWLTLMLFIQGNYLNFGISSLTGDGVGADGFAPGKIVVNTLIWFIVGAASVSAIILLHGKAREWIPTVAVISMITVIGMQAMTFAVGSMTTDAWEPKEHCISNEDPEESTHFLTYKNLDKVSTDHNVIYFVIDRFDVIYYEDYALKECPEIFYNLDGFTYFNDMVSLYPRTFPSVAYMLTGQEHDFLDPRRGYFEQAYQEAPFLKLLKENDYNVNIYTDTLYGYEDARHMQAYVSNSSSVTFYKVTGKPLIAKDMLRLSLFRYLPILAKSTVGSIGTDDFEQYVTYDTEYPKYSTDMKDVHDFLKENPIETYEGKNNFTFVHISGCHMPNAYDENFRPAKEKDEYSAVSSMKQSFKIINRYLDQLKEFGLYEDATIIITGDHGWHGGSDTATPLLRPHVTALFVKESGKSGNPLVTNSAPVIQADIIPTILKSEGIQAEQDFGRSVFEIGVNEERTRKYCWQSLQHVNGAIDYEVVMFEIKGSARDYDNWTIVDRFYVGDIYH